MGHKQEQGREKIEVWVFSEGACNILTVSSNTCVGGLAVVVSCKNFADRRIRLKQELRTKDYEWLPRRAVLADVLKPEPDGTFKVFMDKEEKEVDLGERLWSYLLSWLPSDPDEAKQKKEQ